MAVRVISGASAVDGGDIDISTNIGLARDFERLTYSIPSYMLPDMLSWIQVNLLPGITVSVTGLNFMSFFMYKKPFIYTGDEIFQFDQAAGHYGHYTIDAHNILNIERPIYRFKFYVFMGINTYMLDGTVFSQMNRTHKELYNMLGINSSTEITPGIRFQETSIGYLTDPTLDIRFKEVFFWYLVPEVLAHLLNGEKQVVKTEIGELEFVSDIRYGLQCFENVYNTEDYKFTRSLQLDKKMLYYNSINLFRNPNLRNANVWAVEYAMPWGFLSINNSLKHLDVSLAAPVLFNRNVYNLLSTPLNPIATTHRIRGGIFRDIGECIYIIFPLVERIK